MFPACFRDASELRRGGASWPPETACGPARGGGGTVTSVACRFCKEPLHRAADPVTDGSVWVDEHGHRFGDDPDVADPKPDPYAYLAALGERCVTGKGRKAALDLAAAREYSALKVRLETGGTFHVHQPDSPGPVQEHCGWPGWLRPSGWCCRQCRA